MTITDEQAKIIGAEIGKAIREAIFHDIMCSTVDGMSVRARLHMAMKDAPERAGRALGEALGAVWGSR